MGLRGFLAELRHRGVLRVATAYLAGGFAVFEAGTNLLRNFVAPPMNPAVPAGSGGADAFLATRLLLVLGLPGVVVG